MKATLVFPGIGLSGFSTYGKGVDAVNNFINHGLCSLSAAAKENGFEVDLIDFRKLKNWDEYKQLLSSLRPKVMAFSIMSIDLIPALEAIKLAKTILPQTVIIVGGVHPTLMKDEMQKIKDIDVIICGEGEITFVKVLKLIQEGRPLDKVYIGEQPDLNNLPMIDRELFDIEAEISSPFISLLKPPFITINVGRGCPFKCAFCQPAERLVFGNKVRMRSVDNVIAELKYLYERYKFNSFMVHDDLFTYDRKWIMNFCDEYEKLGIDKKYVCQSRADLVCNNEPMIKRMSETGLACLIIGFESGSQRVLDFIKKGVTVDQNIKAAEICKKYHIEIFANFMFGLPTETKEEVLATVKMMERIDPDYQSPTYFTPHPGSELYDYCKQKNLSLIKDHEIDRAPNSPKIRGVDYRFLDRQVKYLKRRKIFARIWHRLMQLFDRFKFKNSMFRKKMCR